MAIRSRGGKYQVDVKVGEERVRQSAPSLEEARKLEAQIRSTLMQGERWVNRNTGAGRSSSMTVADLLDEYYHLNWKNKDSGHTSYENVQRVMPLLPKGPQTPLHMLTSSLLLDVRKAILKSGNSDTTANRKLGAVRTMMRHAMAMGYIATMPHFYMHKEGPGRMRWLTEEETSEIFRWVDHYNYPVHLALFIVGLETGARMGELRKLKWKFVDLEQGTVMFDAPTTKTKKYRVLPLSTRAVSAFRTLLLRDNAKTGPNDLVFSPGVTRRNVNEVWDKAREAMGRMDDPEFVPHLLRHSCACRLVQNGADIAMVQDWMGHESITTTRRYAKLAPRNLFAGRAILDALNRQIPDQRETVG